MNMLAARLYDKDDLRIEEIPVPQLEKGEILIRVKAATICGTDLRMLKNGAAGIDPQHPLVLNHEFAGVIEKVAPDVDTYRPGQRVAVAPNIGCGICDNCVSGRGHHCHKLTALGIHLDGGFAEFVKIPAAAVCLGNVIPLDDKISFEAAAANEALSCVYNAFERYLVHPGETVVVMGAGAIGMMHAKLALMAGAATVILNDRAAPRLIECAAIEPRITTVEGDPAEIVAEKTNGRGADVVITACSAAEAQKAALGLAGLDGRVNFFGGLPKGRELVELNTNIIHYKQLSITGTTRASLGQYRKTLGFIASGILDVDPLVTHRFDLKDVAKGFENTAAMVGLKQAVVFA